MVLRETTRVALEALNANRMRSFLTMLGIVIGVGAVIAMLALGRGAQQAVQSRISSLGTTLLTVTPAQIRTGGGVASASSRAALKLDDARALEDRGAAIAAVQPEMASTMQVHAGSQNTSTSVVGTTANFLEVRLFKLVAGRMFTTAEDESKRRVVVLGSEVVTDLGVQQPASLVGTQVRIGSAQFEVIGVLASKGGAMGPNNPDDQVLIPLQTARYRLVGGDRLRSISVLAPSEARIAETMAEVTRILRREHRLAAGKEDDFNIRNQSDFLATLSETSATFNMLLAGIAAVSLLVGGIGIMNIMLVSVTERTREIGVRKALGATRLDILVQFLTEALVLCMLGGIVGVALGSGAAGIAHATLGWNTSVDPLSVVVAFLFSAAVGVVFGVWPARRAASLDPIEALRYE